MREPLTPDIAARAIIASAVTLGLDPVEACVSRAGPRRQPLAPAAAALGEVLSLDGDRIATIFGVSPTTMKAHRTHPTRPFLRAKASAEDAIRYALRGVEIASRAEAKRDIAPPPEPTPPPTPRRFIAAALDEATPPKPAPPVPVLSIGGRILAELSARALSTIALSSVLGEKELTVTQALSVLRQEGQVAADQPDERGARHRLWRVAA